MRKKMMTQTAQCRMCGQIVQIETEEELTEPQADEQATMLCTCQDAIEYQKEKNRKEKALRNVDILFGKEAAAEKQLNDNLVALIKTGVEEIYKGGLAKITLNLRGG